MHFVQVFNSAFGIETKIAIAVFSLVIIVMLVAFVASWWRRRRGMGGSQVEERNKLEVGYVCLLAAIAIFLMAFSVTKTNSFFPSPKPDMTVRVIAYQWCWRFDYLGQPVNYTGQCEQGHPPTLVVPADRIVKVEVTSLDVIHSFWVPGLDFKVDAYPHHINTFTFTRLHDGRWLGRCAQLCGLYHSEMLFYLQAIPPARFDAWLHARGGSATAVKP